MATTVYKEEEITLQDGKAVTLRPLVIARLRRFMKAWGEFADAETEDDAMNVYINCCGVALEHNYKDADFDTKLSKDDKEAGRHITDEYKEHLENSLELDSIYKILDVCGGIKLNDPKALEAAVQAAMMEQEKSEDGTTSN